MENENQSGGVSQPVRLASIGVGMIGKVHAKFAAEIDECEYVAICDQDPAHEQMARDLNVAYYNNYEEMIEKEDLDGVIISLPNELHEPVGSYCADKGLHLFVEKPIATKVEDADKLIASAQKNNVQILVAHHRRFNPMVHATREMIKNGELGSMVMINMFWCMYKPADYFVAGPWRRKKGGGPILINTIHEIDVLRYCIGDIERVYAEVSNKSRGFEVEDTVSATVRFTDGTLASILMSDTAPSVWGYECTMGENPHFYPTKGNIYHFLGTEASVSFPGMEKVYYKDPEKKGWQHPITSERLDIKSADPYPGQLAHFCKVITGEEEPRTSGEDARKTLVVTLALHESGMTQKPVQIQY